MGYCIDFSDSKFFINKEDKQKALEAIKALKKNDTLGDRRNYSCYKYGYAWVDTDEYMDADNLEKAMNAWRWEVENDVEGNINTIFFNGEKLGDDKVLFDVIAPYVKKGSFIEMRGEDGCIWRWIFDGKTCEEKTARIVFE